MLVTNGELRHVYQEVIRDGLPRFGRHHHLDARSLAYTIEAELRQLDGSIRPAEHVSPLPVLDQGNLGSCTGNAGTYALAALAGASGLSAVHLDYVNLSQTDAAEDETFARDLYHEATLHDGSPGPWPPNDRGSSGLGVCRALKAAELVHRYTWAITLRGVGHLLQRGGVMLGTPWFEAWVQPDADGFVDADPSWRSSQVVGGHEIYLEALEAWDDRDPHASVVRFKNSWGDSWGDHGSGRMRLSTYVQLKQQMDVKQLAHA